MKESTEVLSIEYWKLRIQRLLAIVVSIVSRSISMFFLVRLPRKQHCHSARK
jgi:hypothetical protein